MASQRVLNVPSAQLGQMRQESMSQKTGWPVVTSYERQAFGHWGILVSLPFTQTGDDCRARISLINHDTPHQQLLAAFRRESEKLVELLLAH
jgi:hypothetical protein